MTSSEHQVIDFERKYWNEAVKTFKEGRKNEKKVDAFLEAWENPDDVKQFCESTKARAGEQYASRLGRILEKIEIAMTVGDVAIKGAPESIGLAWMGIRLCLSSLSDDFSTFDIFGQACLDITGIVISCGVFARMYGPSRKLDDLHTGDLNARVTEQIPKVYAEILDFSFEMKRHMSENKAARLVKGLVRPASEKFTRRLKSIQDHEERMTKYATVTSQQLADYYQNKGRESQETVLVLLKEMQGQLQDSMRLKHEQMQDMRGLLKDFTQNLTPQGIATSNFDKNLSKLGATSDQKADFRSKISRRFPHETCRWIFEQAHFKSWCNTADHAMISVTGAGGVGKSTVMAAVIDQLQTHSAMPQSEARAVNYFFCNRGDGATKKTAPILRHLLSQIYILLRDKPIEIIDKANKILSSFLTTSSSTLQGDASGGEFTQVYSDLVGLLDRPLFIIVDALDECEDSSKPSDGLASILRKLTSAGKPSPKILVCTRPEPDILERLEGIPTIAVEGNNGLDIKRNAEQQLSSFGGWSTQEKKLACDRIVAQAGSYFRYVDLALDFLKQPWQRPLEPHLQRLPKGVNALYEQIIQRTSPIYIDLLKTSLTWAILAGGAIHAPEIMDAYSRTYVTDYDDPTEEEPNEDDLLLMEIAPGTHVNQIRTAGSNFLQVDTTSLVVQQRHSTVADYFLETPFNHSDYEKFDPSHRCEDCQKLLGAGRTFELSEKGGHLSIAVTILKHLMSRKFWRVHILPNQFNHMESYTSESLDEAVCSSEDDGPPEVLVNSAESVLDGGSLEHGSTDQSNSTLTEKLPTVEGPIQPGATEDMPIDPGNDEFSATKDSTDTEAANIDTRLDLASEAETDLDSDVDQFDRQAYNSEKVPLPSESFRYEVNFCSYHLSRVEELWEISDRTGPQWQDFERLRDEFFRDESPYFRAWLDLIRQRRRYWRSVLPSNAAGCAAAFGLTHLLQRFVKRTTELDAAPLDHNSMLDLAIGYFLEAEKGDEAQQRNSLRPLEVLLESGLNPNSLGEGGDGFLPFRALLVGNPKLDAVMLFLNHGADPKAINPRSIISVLDTCCGYCGDLDVLKAIISAGADPNVKDVWGDTPLHSLMSRESIPYGFLEELLGTGADVNAENYALQSPLYKLSSRSGDVEAAKTLIRLGADVLDEDVNKNTALHLACQMGHTDLVMLLIEHGALVTTTDDQGRTPFFMACHASSEDTALYLIESIGDADLGVLHQPNKNGKSPLTKAAASGHENIVRSLFTRLGRDKAIINAQDSRQGQTALHAAAKNGHKAVVEFLLAEKVDIQIKNKHNHTALSSCIKGWTGPKSAEHEKICLILVDASKYNHIDEGVLHGVVMKGNIALVQKLLDNGADPFRQDVHGWNAIQIARHYGQKEVVELLSSRHVSTGLRPEKLRSMNTWKPTGKGLEYIIRGASRIRHRKAIMVADHPIPPSLIGFYFEVEIMAWSRALGEKPDEVPIADFVVGLCSHASPTYKSWTPGNWPYESWAYGSFGLLDHYPSQYTEQQRFPYYNRGDTVGCGFDITKKSVFFTKNGELLFPPRVGQLRTYYVYKELAGRLYPVIGGVGDYQHVRVNFGNHMSKPFLWKPGNGKDAGIAHVSAREQVLSVRPVRRRPVTYGD